MRRISLLLGLWYRSSHLFGGDEMGFSWDLKEREVIEDEQTDERIYVGDRTNDRHKYA